MTSSGSPAARTVDPKQAAAEVLGGDPGPAGQRLLGAVSLAALLGFVVNSYLVISGLTLGGFDAPVAQAVQSVNWGPLIYAMTVTNGTGGLVQDLAGLVIIVALFFYERRAGMLLALGALASLWVQLIKESVARHRPTADLVQVFNPANGFSYPSGHAVFFTWLAFMLAASLSPPLSRRRRVVLWSLAVAVILTACLGRVWAGVHWPSDVIGGFLLGLAWSSFVLWIPERWLPTPKWRWLGRERRVRA